MFDADTHELIRSGTISKNVSKKKEGDATTAKGDKYPPNKQGRAVAVSLKHQHLVVCSNFGKTSIRSLVDFDKKIISLKNAKEWSQCAAYSPDETMLAIGSHDCHVYIYKIDDEGKYSFYCQFKGSTIFITALDWSADSKFIRTNDGAHELLFYSIEDKSQDTHGSTTER